jgi:hypothetical protein
MAEKINKEKINHLIDVLITSGGGHNQYGKLNDIIKLYTTENSLVRNTLLIWLDSMGVMEVDEENNYFLKTPVWIKSSLKDHYILYGALTKKDRNQLELNHKIKKYTENKIQYKNFEIELPDTYYSLGKENFNDFKYEYIDTPIFTAINNMDDMQKVKEKLFYGTLERISYSNHGADSVAHGYKIILNTEQELLLILPQDDVKQFNWRTRTYIKCDLINELNLEIEEEGLKLIKVTKSYEEKHKEYYTILLEKASGQDWNYFYFDRKKVDDRWARYSFIDKLEYYDIEKDFRGRDVIDQLIVFKNVESAIQNNSQIINHNPTSNNFMKIPDVMRKQLVQYDSRQGLMAFPTTMPLPKYIMRYLFSCSGIVPQVFKNKFVINPNYNIKRLFSGVLSPTGNNVPYTDQKYFMEEDFYLFSSVPTQLAEKIFEKLNLDIQEDVFKTTFLQKI